MDSGQNPPITPVSRRGVLSRFFFTASPRSRRLYPRWKRLAIATGSLMVATYLAGAVAVFGIHRWHHRIPTVRLIDVACPWRWAQVKVAQGRHAIAAGIDHADQGRLREAIAHLAFGVARCPEDTQGRLLLADLFVAARRPELAGKLLAQGAEVLTADAAYLEKAFRFLLEHQDDDVVIALGDKLATRLPASHPASRVATLAAATAHYNRGHFDQAEQLLHDRGLENTAEGQLLGSRMNWERGYRKLALVQLRGLADDRPQDAAIHGELLRRLRESESHAEARRRVLLFQLAQPAAVAPRLDLIRAYHNEGDLAAAGRETAFILRDFADNETALLGLAEFAAQTGNPTLIREISTSARLARPPEQAFAFLQIEAQLAAREFAAALESLRSLQRERPDWASSHAALIDGLQATACFGLGERDAGRGYLSQFLLQPVLRVQNLMAIANRLVELDAAEDACRILKKAVAVDDHNQPALSRLIELELIFDHADDVTGHLLRLVTMRKPSPDILRVAHYKLGSDLFQSSPGRGAALDSVYAALKRSPEYSARR